MDPITHSLAGTLLGRSNPSAKRGLVLACVLGALVPDIDIVLTFWGRDFYVTEHRGFTHSFLGILPMSLLAAWVAWFFVRRIKNVAPFKALFGMAFVGVLSHLFLDVCTSWGTMLLWPLRTRYALDHLFIVDLWYAVLFAIPLVLSAFLKQEKAMICGLGLLAVAAYHGLAAYEHHQALAVVQKDAPQAWHAALPEPLSPFRWSAFERQDHLLRNTRLDFLKNSDPLVWNQWSEPPLTPEIQMAFNEPVIKSYLWFARVPVWEVEKEPDGATKVKFWDERFHASLRGQGNETAHRFGAEVVVKDGKIVSRKF